MNDVETRLRDYHRSLVTGFAVEARDLVDAPARVRRGPVRLRWLAAAAAAALVVALAVRLVPSSGPHEVTVQVPGFTIVAAAATAATPRIGAPQAEAAALEMLRRTGSRPQISGYTVTTTTFAPHVVRVSQQCGARMGMPSPHNVWVVGLVAPPQQGLQVIRAAVLVDDDTGHGLMAQILTSSVAATGGLATCHWGT